MQSLMTVKMQYKISIIYLFLFIIFLIVSIKPMPQPMNDGVSYYQMAANYKAFLKGEMGELLPMYGDRLLPVTVVGFLSDVFQVSVSKMFYIVSLLVVVLFYCITFYALSKKVTNIVAMTSLWICYTIYTWPITYNLFNIYQLTDSMTYLWTSLILISFIDKNMFLFIPISFLAIITKQHLWFLVLPGYLFFLLYFCKLRNTKKVALAITFGLIVASIILYLFNVGQGGSKYMLLFPPNIFDIKIYKGKTYSILRDFFSIYTMILPIYFIKYKEIFKKSFEYFPFIPFFIISFVIALPCSLVEPTMDFYPRVMMQVVWPISAYLIVLIVNDFDKLESNSRYLWVLYLAPILCGVAHNFYFTIKFNPLFIFPTKFRYILPVFLLIVYLTRVQVWKQHKIP